MGKIAKLILASFMTRIIIDEDAPLETILEIARKKFYEKINLEFAENIESIEEDFESPFDPFQDAFTE